MIITFEELRNIKHSLPTGSVKKIATQLNLEEQTIRNYFGAKKKSPTFAIHKQAGPRGGIFSIEDLTILNLAKQIIKEQQITTNKE